MTQTLVVNEIYKSIQGEGTRAGLPCVLVRLAGCNLRCSWCDTAYAFAGGARISLDEIVERVAKFDCRLVEITGGEPLLQAEAMPLMTRLADAGHTVLLETSGALDIGPVDPRVVRIMDLKCPASGECDRNRWENIPLLRATDEVKFVIATREDYAWAKQQLEKWRLASICAVLFSWAHPLAAQQRDPSLKTAPPGLHPISLRELVEQMLADKLPVRFQLPLHKYIWEPASRGV
ncbi:MAG: radical SAM protein [Verrucomicrobiae bacterium]|nr:radical SAM protein [Verrucomicrobiae bacterium]